MRDKVLNTINKYNLINDGDKVILGVSGGPDSIAMLNILNDIKNDKNLHMNFDIIVAHVNHMIREEAIDDQRFVENFCKKIGVSFYAKSIDVQKIANNKKIGTEEAGRNARYEFFDEILEKENANKIAIAHNKNDKIETIIMNMLRGSGIAGLKGIEPIKNNKYIRPLIECERFEIEEYCAKNGIEPRIDKTNFENVYTRNKVRNIVIPFIKQEFNPNIIQTMDRLSDLVKEEDEYLEKLVETKYNDYVEQEDKGQIIMNLKDFNKEEKVIKSRLLLYTISRLLGTTKGIEKIHIEDIIKLCEKNIGNKYLTPNKNIKILVKNQKIYFINQNLT
ncbi:tRNA(Ile)-lysidine synthase [Clostridium sp. CAG:389]|nr:tRNA(Ile)-lysidine synthase [Clostridium sp. CAG:389]